MKSLLKYKSKISKEIILPTFIISAHGMIDRKSRLTLYTRNGKVFWKIMPYYNPPASAKQRTCRNAFAEAQKKSAVDLKIPHRLSFWQQKAVALNLKSARQAAFRHFLALSKASIVKEKARLAKDTQQKTMFQPKQYIWTSRALNLHRQPQALATKKDRSTKDLPFI